MTKSSIEKIFIFILISFLSGFALEQQAAVRTALVFSGGGARGLAQIGVIKSFEEHRFKPDLIVATSMGSIIGALYASGYCADSIASIVRNVDWSKIFINNSTRKTLFVSKKDELTNALFEIRFDHRLKPVLPNAISHGQIFYDLLNPLLLIPQFQAMGNFNNLSIPLRIIATDLISGNKVVLTQGNLCTALRASCAVPLAFTPVEIDGYLLVDGGISSNIPVEAAREAGAAIVIAVDVTSPPWKKDDLSNPVKLVDQIVTISSLHNRKSAVVQPDIMIVPEMGDIKNTDFFIVDSLMVDSLINCGYRCTQERWDSLEYLLSSIRQTDNTGSTLSDATAPASDTPAAKAIAASDNYAPVITTMAISGNKRTMEELIHKASGLKPGDTLSPSIITKSLSSLYATDLFDNVNIDIDTAGACHIAVIERLYYRMLMGLRFDEFHRGEIYLEPAYENCFGNGTILLMHLHYGLRREKYTVELKVNHHFSRNIANNLHLKLYSSRERILEVTSIVSDSATMMSTTELQEHTLRKIGSTFSAGAQIGRFALLGFDLRLEKFKVQNNDASIIDDILGLDLTKTLPYLSLRLTMDSMDRYPFPRSGEKVHLSLGGATNRFGGRYSFIKWSGTLGKYFSFMQFHTLFAKISFSMTGKTLPIIERAYIGGAVAETPSEVTSIYNYVPFSGLPPRALIGNKYTIGHGEYRCELKKNLYSIISFDWGPAWDNDKDYGSLAADAPLGIGIGLAYQTFAGPVHLSYGQLIKNSNHYITDNRGFFYFSAGYDF